MSSSAVKEESKGFNFSEQAAKEHVVTVGTIYPFWNPSEDFKGLVECLSDIRHIVKTGNMKSDIDVIDVNIIQGTETRKVVTREDSKEITEKQDKKYVNEKFALVLSKAVLKTKISSIGAPITGKKIVIVGLGKRSDKKYVDYYVATEEHARKDGVIAT